MNQVKKFFIHRIVSFFFTGSFRCKISEQKKIYLNSDKISAETWLEVEKNETIKICINSKVLEWKTSLNTKKNKRLLPEISDSDDYRDKCN